MLLERAVGRVLLLTAAAIVAAARLACGLAVALAEGAAGMMSGRPAAAGEWQGQGRVICVCVLCLVLVVIGD